MSASALCRCGHVRDAHEHYRRGTDCAHCGRDGCPRFRAAEPGLAPAARAVARLLRRLTRR